MRSICACGGCKTIAGIQVILPLWKKGDFSVVDGKASNNAAVQKKPGKKEWYCITVVLLNFPHHLNLKANG